MLTDLTRIAFVILDPNCAGGAHCVLCGPTMVLQRQIEPPRRPPSWYPGQPDPPRQRIRPCNCFYGLRQVENAPGPYEYSPALSGDLTWWTRCFVIVWDCPHHGDDLLDIEAELRWIEEIELPD